MEQSACVSRCCRDVHESRARRLSVSDLSGTPALRDRARGGGDRLRRGRASPALADRRRRQVPAARDRGAASAWFAGTGPALAATVSRRRARHVRRPAVSRTTAASARLHLALFVGPGAAADGVVSELRAARRAAEAQARVAQAARREGEAASRMKDEFLGDGVARAADAAERRARLGAPAAHRQAGSRHASRGFESIERNVQLQAQLTGDLLDVSKALTGRAAARIAGRRSLDDAARSGGVGGRAGGAREGRDASTSRIPDRRSSCSAIRHACGRSSGTCSPTRSSSRRAAARSTSRSRPRRQRGAADGARQRTAGSIRSSCRASSIASPRRTRRRRARRAGSASGCRWCGELVELHGGEIEARNRRDRAGAVFIVRFPLQPADLLGARAPRRRGRSVRCVRARSTGLRVLVARSRHRSARAAAHGAPAARRRSCRRSRRSPTRSNRSKSWRPDVLVSDAGVAASTIPTRSSARCTSLDAERGGRIPALALTALARTRCAAAAS